MCLLVFVFLFFFCVWFCFGLLFLVVGCYGFYCLGECGFVVLVIVVLWGVVWVVVVLFVVVKWLCGFVVCGVVV